MQADTINEGWIKLHRKLLDNPIFKDSEAFHLFGYFLLKANHKPNRFLFNQREIVLERGQLITGLDRISRDTGLTHRQTRTRLALLENLGILTRKTTNRFTIITIRNYNHYQDSKNEERQAERQTNDKQTTTNKNVKNEKNIGRASKKTDADPQVKGFCSFWKETFLRITGQPYVFTYSKEGKLVKSLLQVHSLDALQGMTRVFFRDDQCKRRGLTIGIFFQEINRLLSSKAMDPLEQAKREKWG